ncbi:MAG: SufD family Fe-S cluster assembly protein [Steroidobacteraceae bacterium]
MSALARLVADHAGVAAALPAADARREQRAAALALVANDGLPGPRDENWRYAGLKSLDSLGFTPRLALDSAAIDRARSVLPEPLAGFDRLVFVDGLIAATLSTSPGEASGVGIDTQATLAADFGQHAPDARLGALAVAFAPHATTISAAADAARDIEVLFVATQPGEDAASYPALTIEAGAHSRLRLVERHLGLADGATFTHAAVDLRLGAGAQLRHTRVQQLGAGATHFETLRVAIGADAAYGLDTVALGAQAARTTLHARLAGRGACIAYASSVALDGAQVNDTYAVVEHDAPDTETAEDFRGIAAGRSRVAFNGHILMRPGATRAASRQSLKSLLAGPGAEADVRPQLEIYTDDVKASHGATAGKLDEQMLFYLLSRGIEPRTARSLLKWAFLTELVARIELPALRAQVERAFAQRFTGEDAAVAQELV